MGNYTYDHPRVVEQSAMAETMGLFAAKLIFRRLWSACHHIFGFPRSFILLSKPETAGPLLARMQKAYLVWHDAVKAK
eukprot:5670143-Alexandrium_andersonii.AAC.1